MIGFTPGQVDEMSLWEFAACVEGFRKANGNADDDMPKPPSPEEYYDMVRRLH